MSATRKHAVTRHGAGESAGGGAGASDRSRDPVDPGRARRRPGPRSASAPAHGPRRARERPRAAAVGGPRGGVRRVRPSGGRVRRGGRLREEPGPAPRGVGPPRRPLLRRGRRARGGGPARRLGRLGPGGGIERLPGGIAELAPSNGTSPSNRSSVPSRDQRRASQARDRPRRREVAPTSWIVVPSRTRDRSIAQLEEAAGTATAADALAGALPGLVGSRGAPILRRGADPAELRGTGDSWARTRS